MATQPYPKLVLHLTPDAPARPIQPRTIQAIFDVDGQTIGVAIRPVAVVRSRSRSLLGAAQAHVPSKDASVNIPVPTGQTAPDLTVRIVFEGPVASGRLLWTFSSPYEDLVFSDEATSVDVGDAPEKFAQNLINQVNAREGQPGLYQLLMGIGNTIAEKIPDGFWQALRDANRRLSGRRPTLLILSQEPYIPWELGVIQPPLDHGIPPFLAAQTVAGRWVLGHKRPVLPPPMEQRARDIAVVWGVYSNVPGWNRLTEAEDEAAKIKEKWTRSTAPATIATTVNALDVTATLREVLNCLEGKPRADVLHFAVHGTYNPNSVQNGLVLVDGNILDPLQVKGLELPGTPFVFLNACQVGMGSRVLGDYGGMASAFLYAGASAVIAPLWSIKDTVAKEIALRFYEQARAGARPADIFRDERARFMEDGDASATYLAYQFFGHPAMRLVFA